MCIRVCVIVVHGCKPPSLVSGLQVTDGKVKAAGISNFGIAKIKDLIKSSKTKPAMLQVEIHPYWCAFPFSTVCLAFSLWFNCRCRRQSVGNSGPMSLPVVFVV